MNIKKITTLGLILILSFPMLYLPFSVNVADRNQVSNELNPDDYILVETFEYTDGTKETIITRDGKTSIVEPGEISNEAGLSSPISIADNNPSAGGVGCDASCEVFDIYGEWVLIYLIPMYVYYKFWFHVWCECKGLLCALTDNLHDAKFRIYLSGNAIYSYDKDFDLWVKSYTLIVFRINPIPTTWAGQPYEGYCWARDDDSFDLDPTDGSSETGSFSCYGNVTPIPTHDVELEILGYGTQPIYDDELTGGFFRITNHGDILSEQFHISCPGLEKATVTYSMNDFWLDPGEYAYFGITLDPIDIGTDNFDVKVTSYTYGTTDSVSCSITIIDDDDTPPVIEYIYTGDYTDGNPGEIIVTATDPSGLFVDPSGIYTVQPYLGTQDFTFFAQDNDTDRPDDRLSHTIDVPITIVDDDTTPPVIGHIYTGDYTDGNPGEIVVTATDPSGLSVDPSGTYPVEPILGTQDFYFDATDNDNDRPGEDDTSTADTLHVPITIVDDDETDPYFENLVITDDHLWVNISFNGIDIQEGDDSGLSLIEIYVDGDLKHTYFPTPAENSFYFSLINEWIWNPGIHDIQIDITDADNDRPSDSLSNIAYGEFEVTLDAMYQYVMWLCEEMNNYIYDNNIVALYGVVTQKLVKIQTLLWEAYLLIQDGYLHTGLVRQKMAEIKLEIADTKTELMINKQSMSQEHFDHLKECIRDIRNKIVELMGLSVGTDFSHDVSLVEIDVYNLRDFVEENIPALDSENLVNAITLTTQKIEDALFDISLGKSTEGSLTSAENALDKAKIEVFALAKKGKITEALKLELLAKIIIIQVEIEDLKQNI
ncbi:MAG: hypothetical protein ACFFG0_51420 [Candidatus Thorarchaeota archaeon]